VVHVVPERLAAAMNATSASVPYATDEFALAGLAKLPCEKIAPPRVAEAPVAMECRLHQIVEVGRGGSGVIIGEILLWHVDDAVVVEGRIDMGLLDPIGRMAGPQYARTRDRFSMPRPK
jgi:flavin reductase (DIM6/NTAB) family NADH-FMN oxidoreductase RutF